MLLSYISWFTNVCAKIFFTMVILIGVMVKALDLALEISKFNI